eukprot:COSAG01_NODE_15535_length_1325_cov_1.660962_2_plen_196_part_00
MLFFFFCFPPHTGAEDLATFPEECYACGSAGLLKMKLTNIPHFKEIVLMCFTCDSCGYKSVDVKPGGEICEKGVEFRLSVPAPSEGEGEGDGPAAAATSWARVDLARDVIKSADASVSERQLRAINTLGRRRRRRRCACSGWAARCCSRTPHLQCTQLLGRSVAMHINTMRINTINTMRINTINTMAGAGAGAGV